MKSTLAMVAGAFMSLAAFGQVALPESYDISSILLKDGNLSLGLNCPGEMAQHGAVVDINGDGIDDFVISGLFTTAEDATSAFLRVYFGVKDGTPVLKYDNSTLSIGGNGALDAFKDANGNTFVAVQGGALGNWTNPYKLNIYKISMDGDNVKVDDVANYQGAGRGSILFVDMDNDGHMDMFQNGWSAANEWNNVQGIYINDGTDEWWDEQTYESGSEPIRPSSNCLARLGDVNNDGKVDILVPMNKSNGLYLYTNNGDKTFKETLISPFNLDDRTDGRNYLSDDDAEQAEFIDFNNDGYLDIMLIGTNSAPNKWEFIIEMFKNNGDGTFSLIEQKNFAGEAATWFGGQRADIAVGDFNCDGNMDMIIGAESESTTAGWSCQTYWMPGNGQGGFDEYLITYNKDSNPNGIVAMCRRAQFGQFLVGDFNGDKKTDLVTIGGDYYGGNGDLRFYANQSATAIEGVSESEASVYAFGRTLCVANAAGKAIKVYSLTGEVLAEAVASNGNFSMAMTPGCYIVKVGTVASKLIVK